MSTAAAQAICAQIGAEFPSEDGIYFVSLFDFMDSLPENERVERYQFTPGSGQRELSDRLVELSERLKSPWHAMSEPLAAAWLKRVEKPLRVALEASRHTSYFMPYFGDDTDRTAICQLRWRWRELAVALLSRATLRIGEKQFQDAWEDIIGCMRLVHLLGARPAPWNVTVAAALQARCCQTISMFCVSADVSHDLFMRMQKDVASLPGFCRAEDVLALNRIQRLAELSVLICPNKAESTRDSGIEVDGIELSLSDYRSLLVDSDIDWRHVIDETNRRYDEWAQVAMRPIGQERLQDADEKWPGRFDVSPGVLLNRCLETTDKKLRLKRLTEFVSRGGTLDAKWFQAFLEIRDRVSSRSRALPILIALARYRTARGAMPDVLTQLTPSLIPELPVDPVSGKPFGYSHNERRFLLYSIGYDGADQGGTTYSERGDGPFDDLTISDTSTDDFPK